MTGKQQPERQQKPADGLELDRETVKDLEPSTPADVRGGRSSSGGSHMGSVG